MTRLTRLLWLISATIIITGAIAHAEDWPMWRFDTMRSAASTQTLPDTLHLQWVRTYPRVQPAFKSRRLQFDAGYEPVVKNKTLFVGSPINDSVTAMNTATGTEKWSFYTDGPVRFAPVAWKDKVFAASDDGCLYCLDADTGTPLWTFRAVPSQRKIIGNGRLMSVWPIRGGPILEHGRIYFAAGIWPFEGIFVYALDADTGDIIWRNDRCGSLYLGHPHGAWSFGGPSLQGYLVINGDDLLVPNGIGGVPAYFDKNTGELRAFAHLANRVPGSWFVTADPNGTLNVDSDYNRELHEDRFYETRWSNSRAWLKAQTTDPWANKKWQTQAGSRHSISVAGKKYAYDKGFKGVEGKVLSMLAADNKMFVVTDEGSLYCFGVNPTTPKKYSSEPASLRIRKDEYQARVKQILKSTGKTRGYAQVWGVGTGRLLKELATQTEMHIIAVDPDARKVHRLRRQLDRLGLYGRRVVIHVGDPMNFGFPSYLADLIIAEDLTTARGSGRNPFVEKIFACLRPYGGTACLSHPDNPKEVFAKRIQQANLANAQLVQSNGLTLLKRVGALPGTSNYTGQWKSPDALVKAPLGVLWYDDSVRQFKRSPQPDIVDGIMISQPKAWLTTERPYALEKPTFADVYTGRVLSNDEARATLKTLPKGDPGPQTPQYRQPDVNKTKVWSTRINPVTGLTEPRMLPKSYGCEPGVDYGHMITMRSGTGAFYDKRIESGLINITGIRTGCTNSIIPANGVLNVPYFYEGCTCGYPLASGLAMVHMPETYEQWMAWGDTKFKGRIKRLGINFGAPGDRMTESGTLWLDYPSVGGPSPTVSLDLAPKNPTSYYHHSLWIKGGDGLPWVTASGIKGMKNISIGLIPDPNEQADTAVLPYTVRLYFGEPEDIKPGARVFSVSLQGTEILTDLDIVKAAGGNMRGIVKEFKHIKLGKTLEFDFSATTGVPILSGIELIVKTP